MVISSNKIFKLRLNLIKSLFIFTRIRDVYMDNAPIHECKCNCLPASQSEPSEAYITLSEAIDYILTKRDIDFAKWHIELYSMGKSDMTKLYICKDRSKFRSSLIFYGYRVKLSRFTEWYQAGLVELRTRPELQ